MTPAISGVAACVMSAIQSVNRVSLNHHFARFAVAAIFTVALALH